MGRRSHYFPLSWPFMASLVALVITVMALVAVGVVQYVYQRLGVPPAVMLVIFLAELLGSSVNVPIARMRSARRTQLARVVVFGVSYIVPVVSWPTDTVIAVNLGGAVIPVGLSVYLLIHTTAWAQALACTAIVAVAVHAVARPVTGLGIAVPGLLPAAVAAAAAAALAAPHQVAAVAFCAGTLGTLVGADILNLRKIPALGTPVASIGGAGTFDAVFVTGIAAVLLVTL